MRAASVCSGIGGFEKAAENLGWQHVFVSEIDPFANAVLAHHYPHIPNAGDMLKIEGKKYEGQIGIITGGTPCQSFSNAGRQHGLADPRGRLSPALARLAHGARADWLLWRTGVSHTLTTKQYEHILAGAGVRRMTPTECERLMGYPDGYTAVPVNGRPAGDYARCAALGNSWTINSARFICERIDLYSRGLLE